MHPRPTFVALASLVATLAASLEAGCGAGDDAPPTFPSYEAGPIIVLPAPGKDASSGKGAPDARHDAGHDATQEAEPVTDAAPDVTNSAADVVTDVQVAPDARYPAFDPTPPQVVDNEGLILTSAHFVPVVFAGETLAEPIAAFMAAIGSSQYWATIGLEYGVGPATSEPLVVEGDAPSAATTDAEIQTWLAQAIATDPRFLAVGTSPDAGIQPADPSAVPPDQTVYVLFYPAGTVISDVSGVSCEAFGGYHFSTTLGNGATVYYAVIPRCADFDHLSPLESLTAVTSHELIEVTTDPDTYASPGFIGVDANHYIWELVVGQGEVGDMCSFLPDAWIYPAEPALSPYLVQRMWSNQAAAAGLDPCVPATGETTYFASVPETAEVPFVDQGMSYQTLGNAIPVGQTATVTFDLYSNAPTGGPWSVYLLDYGAAYNNPTVLDIQPLGTTLGSNGQKVSFAITPQSAGTAALFGMSPYFIYSTQGSVSTFGVGTIVN